MYIATPNKYSIGYKEIITPPLGYNPLTNMAKEGTKGGTLA